MPPTILHSTRTRLRVPLYAITACLLFSGIVQAQPAQRPSTSARGRSVEEQVLQASREWADAWSRSDVAAVDRLLSDDFISIQQSGNSLGLIEKQVQLDSLRKAGASQPKTTRELSRTRVRTYGNVAILTAVATYVAELPSGVTRTQGLVAEVWVNAGGQWRLAHFQPTAQLVPTR